MTQPASSVDPVADVRLPATRVASPRDIPEIVTVHIQSFKGFFLTFLGREFLSLLYGNLLNDCDGIMLVQEQDGRVAGFVAGTASQIRFYRRMLTRRAFAFAWAAIGALFKKPAVARRLLRVLRRPAEARRESAEASLMSIAVRPEYEGRGIGQQLVRAFAAELAARGVRSYCLTTDRDRNERAHRFYRRLGLRLVNEHKYPEGRVKSEYLMELEG